MSDPPAPPDPPDRPAHPDVAPGYPPRDPQYPPPGTWDPPPQAQYPAPGRPADGSYGYPDPSYRDPAYPDPGYPDPGYPPPGYPPPGYPPPGYPPPGYPPDLDEPTPGPRGPGLWAGLGPLVLRRPEPRQSISLAAAGVALVLAGIVIWAGGYFVDGVRDISPGSGDTLRVGYDDGRRFLGAGLAFALTAAGYALVIIRRRGPLATAGVLGGAIGLPLGIGFLSLDVSGALRGAQVVNIDAVFVISIVAWLISYLLIPGARGRAFYLGAAAYALASYVSVKTGGNEVAGFAASTTGSGSTRTGGLGGVSAVDLVFGLGYYLLALLLDRTGRQGAAVAFVFAGFVATVAGIAAGIPTFGQAGTGVVLIVLGLALSWYGSRYGRRFTTWVWAAAVALGIGVIVQDVLPDSAAGAGITLVVVGLAVVAAAESLLRVLQEPPDVAAQTQLTPTPG